MQLLSLLTKFKRWIYVGILLLVSAVFFWFGYKVSSAYYEKKLGDYEKRIADISEAITLSQNEAIIRHNSELETERKKFVKAQADKAKRMAKVENIKNEASKSSSTWDANERLRIENLYRIYGYN